EKAIVEAARTGGPDGATSAQVFVREYPLSRQLLVMSRAYKTANGYLIASKGAPEAIFKLCRIEDRVAELSRVVESMAARGLRMLGVAQARITTGTLPESQETLPFQFLGLLGFVDPVRSSVPAAVAQCRSAGIRVVMITGDYPLTARTIAAQVGL